MFYYLLLLLLLCLVYFFVSFFYRSTFWGSLEYTQELLSSGLIDIDDGDPDGYTPLMYAAQQGEMLIAKLLLSKKANPSIGNADGFTPAILAVNIGDVAIVKMLVAAGADLEAPLYYNEGYTALHMALCSQGPTSLEMARTLIEAGANTNSRAFDGSTPLYIAASIGSVEATKMLLRVGANALLTKEFTTGDEVYVPLEAAASRGYLEVVRELIQQVGIEGCGGASGGVDALEYATSNHHLEIMATLTAAGVVDSGKILTAAAGRGQETWVKSLLQQEREATSMNAYVNNTCDNLGRTALLFACGFARNPNPRIARMLVDAGADTTSAVLLEADDGEVEHRYSDTPLGHTTRLLQMKTVEGRDGPEDATEDQLHRLEAIRRLLLRVEAVHAVSWLWPSNSHSSIVQAAESTSRSEVTSDPLTRMLLMLRQRARRRDGLLASLLRWAMQTVSWLWPRGIHSIAPAVESRETKAASTQLISMLPILRRSTRRREVLWAAVPR